jgi:hypothetical protein
MPTAAILCSSEYFIPYCKAFGCFVTFVIAVFVNTLKVLTAVTAIEGVMASVIIGSTSNSTKATENTKAAAATALDVAILLFIDNDDRSCDVVMVVVSGTLYTPYFIQIS